MTDAILTLSGDEFALVAGAMEVVPPPLLLEQMPADPSDETCEAVVRGLVAHGVLAWDGGDDEPELARVPAQVLGILSAADRACELRCTFRSGERGLSLLPLPDAVMTVAVEAGVLRFGLAAPDAAEELAVDLLALAGARRPSAAETVELAPSVLERGREALESGDDATAATLLGGRGLALARAHRATYRLGWVHRHDGAADTALAWWDCGAEGLWEYAPGMGEDASGTLAPLDPDTVRARLAGLDQHAVPA